MFGPRILLIIPELYLPVFKEALGYSFQAELTMVSDGKQGLELIQKNVYDVYLINYLLPHYTGLELVGAIPREHRDHKVLVLISQVYTESLISHAKKAGVTRFFKTPLAMPELIEYLHEAL